MPNRFDKFAAASSSASKSEGGWMATKKKGKDDAQIKRDSAKALALRKSSAKQRNKPLKGKGGRKDQYSDDESDGDLDDFIVDDEEEISEEEYSSDADELDLVDDRKPAAESSGSDSDSENYDSFFKDMPKRTSIPPPGLRASAAKSRKAPPRYRSTKQRPIARSSKRDPVLLLSSDEESPAKVKSMASQIHKTPFIEEKKGDDTDFSQDDLVDTPAKNKSSRYFQKADPLSTASNGSAPSDYSPFVHARPVRNDSDVEVVEATDFKRSASGRVARASSLADSSDDDMAEALAISKAVANSLSNEKKPAFKRLQKQSNKPKKKKKTIRMAVNSEDDVEEVLDLAESSSDEDDTQQEAYEDEEAREAGSALKIANDLSAQVLQAVSSWAQSDDGVTLPKGIIVEGAVSLATCSAKSACHLWISQEEMRAACPHITLSDYQLIGVNWLALLHGLTCEVDRGNEKRTTNVNGVLADEMGLGKTAQTIAFLAWLRYKRLGCQKARQGVESDNQTISLLDDDSDIEAEGNSTLGEASFEASTGQSSSVYMPHLIVVPAGLLANWEIEFKKFCPELNIVTYYGTMAERAELQDSLRKHLPGAPRGSAGSALDVILTPISNFSKEKSDDRAFLRKFRFEYMIIDEAHALKDAKGARYRNLDKFSSAHRLLLTGTPVQNSPKELMALLCFLMPLFSRNKGASGGYEEGRGNDGGESMLQHFVSMESSGAGEFSNEVAYRKLKQLFAPFVLRRRKHDVLRQLLEPKTTKVELVPLDDATRQVYDSLLANHIHKREEASAGAGSYSERQHLFTALRKAANHPLLLRTRHKTEEDIAHLAKYFYLFGHFGFDTTCTDRHVRSELEKYSDLDIHLTALGMIEENKHRRDTLSRFVLEEEDLFSSPKFVRLRSLLPDLVVKGHRILIFSQWTKCMDLLGCLVESLGLRFLRLDGNTTVSDRQELIDEFNQDDSIPVFLLSTRAGGMGINLTAADVCILHDLDFNPFNDEQAESRCHRIGQRKPVTVVKMVTQDTVDEGIYKMQQRKAKMNAAILDSAQSDSSSSASSRKDDDRKEINNMLQSAVHRYLHSPEPAKRAASK